MPRGFKLNGTAITTVSQTEVALSVYTETADYYVNDRHMDTT